MRILHLADVHLDRPFVGLPRHIAKRRRGELFDAFRRCLAVARDRQADLVTVGGDLWEEEHVTADTRNSVAHELSRLDLPVVLICGNHDPLLPGGSYQRTEWPANVTIFPRGRVDEASFGEVSVWGISWGGGDLPANLMETLAAPDDGRVHLLLLHGTAGPLAALTEEAYFPFDPERVRNAGFAVCLAGHVHVADQASGVIYPGSPEPLGWGEAGRHCVAVVEIEGGEPRIELVDINESRCETRQVDCTGCGSSAAVAENITAALTDDDANRVFLRLQLVGEVDPECEIDPGRLARQHESRYAALVVDDRTEPLLDLATRAERKGLEGLFVRTLLTRLDAASSDDERRHIELAIHAGLRAIDGREDLLYVD